MQAGGARSGWARVGGLLRRVDMAVQSLVQSNPVTSADMSTTRTEISVKLTKGSFVYEVWVYKVQRGYQLKNIHWTPQAKSNKRQQQSLPQRRMVFETVLRKYN